MTSCIALQLRDALSFEIFDVILECSHIHRDFKSGAGCRNDVISFEVEYYRVVGG